MIFTRPLLLLLLLLLPLAAFIGAPAGWPAGLRVRGRASYGARREVVSLVLRLLLLLCLVLSLAGLELVRPSPELATVFLVDVSDSLPAETQAAALDWVEQAMQSMGPDDQAAVILFGGEALVERRMLPGELGRTRQLGPVTSIPATDHTDLNEAIRLGLALYPPGAARRMVILSDGQVNVNPEGLESSARLAGANAVQILAYPLPAGTGGPEVLVTSVDTPTRLRQGERFSLRLALEASQSGPAVVRVFAGSQQVFSSAVELERGRQAFSLTLEAGEPGFHVYRVQVEAQGDTHYQNNELATFSQVEGPPRLLIVAPAEGEPMRTSSPGVEQEPRPDEAATLVQTLQDSQFIVEQVTPSAMPFDLVGLAQYRAVILVDVPARQLTQGQMENLQSYVRDLGGGLLVVGGPTSYGVGGYYRSPLEETLPVEMQIKDPERRSQLTIVFIIDHSGSMSDTSGGVAKLELAKEAVIRSVEMLFPGDQVGVVAFDDAASWVVPITLAEDPGAIQNAVATIRSGGGTDILAGLQAVARALTSQGTANTHVILLTDGGADPTGIPGLVTQMRNSGVTLTTVGVGQDAAPFLSDLAVLGGGRYHFTADASAIPRIFTEETTLATRSYLVEHTFTPALAGTSPILNGITALPPLQGYVGTSIKDTAQAILVSDLDDPILAEWQYGLGRAVAFTSDATGRWAPAWVSWQGFPVFWGQAVSAVLGQTERSPLEVRVEDSNSQSGTGQAEAANLVVEARNEAGAYLNDYTLQASVVAPDGSRQSLNLQQVAPGRYESAFVPSQPGAYLIGVAGEHAANGTSPDAPEAVQATGGWVYSYSAEYRPQPPDSGRLERLAQITGGSLVTEPQAVFIHNLPSQHATRPVWPWLLALAALLLPFDIAVRRLVVTPAEVWSGLLQRLRSARAALLGRTRPAVPTALSPADEQRLSALQEAKKRSTRNVEPPHVPAQTEPPAAASVYPARQDASPPSASPPASVSPAAASPPAARPPAQNDVEDTDRPDSGATHSRLLDAKRKRRQDRGSE